MQRVVCLLILLVSASTVSAQDLQITQLTSNPFVMCPAQVGNSENPRATMLYRYNWASSCLFGFDAPVEKLHGGVGLWAVYNNHGYNYSDKSVNGVYSFCSDLSDEFSIKSAVYLGLANRHQGNYVFSDTNYTHVTGIQDKTYFDQGLSLAFDYKKLSFGLSCFHLLKPDVGFTYAYRLDRSFSLFIGYDLWMMKGEKHNGFGVTPLLNMTIEGNFLQTTVGFDFVWNSIYAGTFYRLSDMNSYNLIYHAGARIGRFQFGYAYDNSGSNQLSISGNGHEVFLNYFFEKKP